MAIWEKDKIGSICHTHITINIEWIRDQNKK